jgi:hypothetical protein
MMSENDRVSYSFGAKINIGNYQSIDFHVSYSSDVKDDEKADSAYGRVKKYVESKAELEIEKIQREFMSREF